jgi:hypothetical protein
LDFVTSKLKLVFMPSIELQDVFLARIILRDFRL